MAFYSDFAGHYELVFPCRDEVFRFLDERLPPTGRVLDVGCGTGGYCERLAVGGRECLGVDLDPGMIAAAESAHLHGEFRIMGMGDIGALPAGGFTGVICLGNVLPHLPKDELGGFLRDVYRLLAPGGVWLFQTVNFDPLLAHRSYDFPVLELPEDSLQFHRSYTDISDESLVFATHLVQGGRQVFAGETTLYPLRARDYLAAHRDHGFILLDHFADYNGREYDPLVVSGNVMVFRRPA